MTTCLEFEMQISEMLDGELPEAERPALEEHLRTCESCAAVYREFQSLSALLKDSAAEPPAGLAEQILNRIDEEKTVSMDSVPGKRRNWRTIAAMAACFAVIVGVAVFAGPGLVRTSAPAAVTLSSRSGGGGYVPEKTPELAAGEAAVPEDAQNAEPAVNLGQEDKTSPLTMTAGGPLSEEQSRAVLALLTESTEAEAPDAQTQPACVAAAQGEDGTDTVATVWIDGEDLLFTTDGEHYFRTVNAAAALQEILNS